MWVGFFGDCVSLVQSMSDDDSAKLLLRVKEEIVKKSISHIDRTDLLTRHI